MMKAKPMDRAMDNRRYMVTGDGRLPARTEAKPKMMAIGHSDSTIVFTSLSWKPRKNWLSVLKRFTVVGVVRSGDAFVAVPTDNTSTIHGTNNTAMTMAME